MKAERNKKQKSNPLSKTGERFVKQCGGVTRRDFMKYSAGTVACLSLGSLTYGCGSSN
ncbi:MAG: twin-arginine translocation signal domain-containing protein, partial [Proteobacteria bacterium]|nr:twin-arginine translocation signal domain-containing protein [Pseudomonadota bacterium]